VKEMSDWTVTVETTLGLSAGDEALESIHEALDGDPVTGAPVVAIQVPLPIITARFQVQAESTDEAQEVARSAFERALAAAGVTATCKVSGVEPA
jgi:hypothetical protein